MTALRQVNLQAGSIYPSPARGEGKEKKSFWTRQQFRGEESLKQKFLPFSFSYIYSSRIWIESPDEGLSSFMLKTPSPIVEERINSPSPYPSPQRGEGTRADVQLLFFQNALTGNLLTADCISCCLGFHQVVIHKRKRFQAQCIYPCKSIIRKPYCNCVR